MATGNEILAYKGDAASGIASSAGATSVAGMTNAEPLSDLVKSIALNSFHKNRIIFDQKIKDRDAAYKALDDEALVLTNVLDSHRPMLEEKIRKVKDVFMSANGDVMGDPQKYREFQEAIKDAKEHVKQAQKKFLGVEADMKKRAEAGNPIDMRKYDQHIDKETKRDFWTPYVPFAPITDYKLEVVAAPFSTTTRTYREGLENVTEVLPDVRSTMNAYRANYLKNEYNHMFPKYVNDMIKVPNADDLVTRVQQGITKLNAETGAQPGDVNYVEPLKVEKNKVTGEYELLEDYGTAAAKIKLSEAGKTVTRDFDAERASHQRGLAQQAETRRHNIATEGINRGELQLEKDKWAATQNGGDTQINGAMQRAKRIVEDIRKLANAQGVITPDKIRQLNQEQLKYLGMETVVEDDAGGVKKSVFTPMALSDRDAIQIDDKGNIKVMKPKEEGGKVEVLDDGRVTGYWDNNRSTNIYNVATNILNEELKVAGAKELSTYWRNVDDPNAPNSTGPSVTTTGGSSSQSGSVTKLTGSVDRKTLKPGERYEVGGKIYTWNGSKLVQQ